METTDILVSLKVRADELTKELGRVHSAIKELSSNGDRSHAGVRQPEIKQTRRRRGATQRANGKRVTREQQVVELLTNHASEGGMTIPELAGVMKIEPNYLYRVMPKIKGAKVDSKTKKWKLG